MVLGVGHEEWTRRIILDHHGEIECISSPDIGTEFRINVHSMPGPSKNHRAFLLEEERMLLCGGMVAEDRLAPLDPGSSNVAALVESLEAASKMRLRRLAPVHGYIVEEAKKAVPAEIESRAAVDAAILSALNAGGGDNESTRLRLPLVLSGP